EDGGILAISGNHLYRLSGQVFSALPDPPRIAYLHVLPVPGLGLWASAREYFGRFRDGRWQEVALAPGMTPASLLGTTRGPRQSIWAVSTDSVRKYENGVWQAPRMAPKNFRFAAPIHAIEDSGGNLWVGDFYNGLLVFRKDGTIQQIGREQGLPNSTI